MYFKCPRCKEKAAQLNKYVFNGNRVIYCGNCSFSIGAGLKRKDIIKLWNSIKITQAEKTDA